MFPAPSWASAPSPPGRRGQHPGGAAPARCPRCPSSSVTPCFARPRAGFPNRGLPALPPGPAPESPCQIRLVEMGPWAGPRPSRPCWKPVAIRLQPARAVLLSPFSSNAPAVTREAWAPVPVTREVWTPVPSLPASLPTPSVLPPRHDPEPRPRDSVQTPTPRQPPSPSAQESRVPPTGVRVRDRVNGSAVFLHGVVRRRSQESETAHTGATHGTAALQPRDLGEAAAPLRTPGPSHLVCSVRA